MQPSTSSTRAPSPRRPRRTPPASPAPSNAASNHSPAPRHPPRPEAASSSTSTHPPHTRGSGVGLAGAGVDAGRGDACGATDPAPLDPPARGSSGNDELEAERHRGEQVRNRLGLPIGRIERAGGRGCRREERQWPWAERYSVGGAVEPGPEPAVPGELVEQRDQGRARRQDGERAGGTAASSTRHSRRVACGTRSGLNARARRPTGRRRLGSAHRPYQSRPGTATHRGPNPPLAAPRPSYRRSVPDGRRAR